jgi:predicted nucleic acid-binding protein
LPYDINLLLDLLSGGPVKANRANALIVAGGVISVQVLSEFAAVASRRLRMRSAERKPKEDHRARSETRSKA